MYELHLGWFRSILLYLMFQNSVLAVQRKGLSNTPPGAQGGTYGAVVQIVQLAANWHALGKAA